METRNVFADEWDDPYPPIDGWRSRVKRLVGPGNSLGMSLYELEAGQTQCPYHFHHGADELILVLHGSPTLRTPDGERELEPGDVVHFPKGSAGAQRVAAQAAAVDDASLGRRRRLPGRRAAANLTRLLRSQAAVFLLG